MPAASQEVGESWRLNRPDRAIPGHPGPGDVYVSVRYDHGSIARVTDIDPETGWFRVEVSGSEASWIIQKYFGEKISGPSTPLGEASGDQYFLYRPGKTIPGHPAAGDRSVSIRFDHGAIATVLDTDPETGWYQVDVGGQTAWIIGRYLGDPVPQDGPGTDETIVVGSWNIEYLHETASRGFPEMNGEWGPRTDNDYASIASVIADDLDAAVLVLEEIEGQDTGYDDMPATSSVLDRLLTHLPDSYSYLIGTTGKSQRVAMLFDTDQVLLRAFTEIYVPEQLVSEGGKSKDIFDRDPIVAYFSAMSDGIPRNDFIVVGLHLASGQKLAKNHDKALKVLQSKLDDLLEEDGDFPKGEGDVILTGDFNLNFFDSKREKELEDMEEEEWDVLAEESTYPATRLARTPLRPWSVIDYVVVTDEMRGSGSEIGANEATVWQSLMTNGAYHFREHFSDHFPVTVEMRVLADDD